LSVFSSDVLIDGGSTGTDFEIYRGSTVDLASGTIGLSSTIGSDSTLNVDGGTVGRDFSVLDKAVFNLNEGRVETSLFATRGGVVNVNGGFVGTDFFVSGDDTLVEVNGGIISELRAINGATINVNGGVVGRTDGGFINSFELERGSTLNLRGGFLTDGVVIRDDAIVNIFGSEFFLDDDRLDLLLGERLILDLDLGGVLRSTLLDGTIYELDLNDFSISRDTTVSLTLAVPEPSSSALVLLTFVSLLVPRRRMERARIGVKQ